MRGKKRKRVTSIARKINLQNVGSYAVSISVGGYTGLHCAGSGDDLWTGCTAGRTIRYYICKKAYDRDFCLGYGLSGRT